MVLVKINAFGSFRSMNTILLHVRGALIAVVALALSAGLAFAAHPSATTFSLDSSVSSQAAGHEASSGADQDVEVDETTGGDADAKEAGEVDEVDDVGGPTDGTTDQAAGGATGQTTGQDPTIDTASTNCLTDPTTLTVEALAAMSHGSIVCWAAHQTTWPAEFQNHGAWVSSWAHMGKGTVAVAAKATTKAHGTKAHKGKGHKATI
jgi:hypothetical protein